MPSSTSLAEVVSRKLDSTRADVHPMSEGKKPRSEELRELVAEYIREILGGAADVDDDPVGELDDDTVVLLTAMAELDQEWSDVEGRAWSPAQHARWPKGHPDGGKFKPMVDLLKEAIAHHDGKGHPFDNFKREQLVKAAKVRGITLKRGEDKDSIAAKLLADLDSKAKPGKTSAPTAKKTAPVKKAGTVAKPREFSRLTPDAAQAMQDRMLKSQPWTQSQRDALTHYSTDAYKKINGALHPPPGTPPAKVKAQIRETRAALRPLPHDVKVYRGVDHRGLGLSEGDDLNKLIGRTFQNGGFSSMATDLDGVEQADHDGFDAILEIDVPAGTLAAYMESLTENEGEHELLADAGLKFEFVQMGEKYRGRPVIRARVVPA